MNLSFDHDNAGSFAWQTLKDDVLDADLRDFVLQLRTSLVVLFHHRSYEVFGVMSVD